MATESDQKISLDPDVYCSLVKCAFDKAFDRRSGQHDGSNLFKQLVNSLVDAPGGAGVSNPPAPKTGELNGNLKASLDAIKSDFLDHYSLLYNLEEYSIKERLEILGKHSPIEEIVASESSLGTTSHKGATPATRDVADGERPEAQERTVSQGVLSMVDSIKHKFEALNNRIEALDNEIDAQVGDPNLREWEHSKETAQMRGKHSFEGDEELCTHVRNLYSHLHHQAKLNEQKIEAMRNRLLTLQAHAKVISRRQPNDTRIAF